jgi:hypothetical protein
LCQVIGGNFCYWFKKTDYSEEYSIQERCKEFSMMVGDNLDCTDYIILASMSIGQLLHYYSTSKVNFFEQLQALPTGNMG